MGKKRHRIQSTLCESIELLIWRVGMQGNCFEARLLNRRLQAARGKMVKMTREIQMKLLATKQPGLPATKTRHFQKQATAGQQQLANLLQIITGRGEVF
jgi:hypothetical protein